MSRSATLNHLRSIWSHAHRFYRNLQYVFDYSDVVVKVCWQALDGRDAGQIFLPAFVVGVER